jgi:hypothetical protein
LAQGLELQRAGSNIRDIREDVIDQ